MVKPLIRPSRPDARTARRRDHAARRLSSVCAVARPGRTPMTGLLGSILAMLAFVGAAGPAAASPEAPPIRPPTAAAPPHAGALPGASSRLAACLILPSRVADIGSPLAGIVESVEVERGDAVVRGAVLVRLQADVERARATVARTRADSEAELRGATAAEALARQRLDRSKALHDDRFLSAQAVEQADAEYRLAVEKVAQARDALRVSMGESGVSSAQMAQRLIRAPFSGVVTERFAQPGERFEEKPLLRLAEIDELRAEVVVPSQRFGQIRLGQPAWIEPDLPGQVRRAATVIQIDQVLDPASNTFRVRLALPNPDRALPAGLRCRADFDATAARPATAAPVPVSLAMPPTDPSPAPGRPPAAAGRAGGASSPR